MRRATTRRGSVSTLPASRRAAKPAGSLKRLQRIAQALVLDRQRVAQLRSRQHHALDQKGQHSLLETASLTVSVLELGDDLQVGRLGVSRDQFQMDRRPCWRRAVLAGKHQVFPDSPEISPQSGHPSYAKIYKSNRSNPQRNKKRIQHGHNSPTSRTTPTCPPLNHPQSTSTISRPKLNSSK